MNLDKYKTITIKSDGTVGNTQVFYKQEKEFIPLVQSINWRLSVGDIGSRAEIEILLNNCELEVEEKDTLFHIYSSQTFKNRLKTIFNLLFSAKSARHKQQIQKWKELVQTSKKV